MAHIIVSFKMDDTDLHAAIGMIYPDVQPQAVVDEYFSKNVTFDFDRISEAAKRMFILSGTVANHILLAGEMEDADEREKPQSKIITLKN